MPLSPLSAQNTGGAEKTESNWEKKKKEVEGMKKFFSEFQEFAMRGNVMDLAIGVVLGSAFSAIVNSLVADLFMPLIGMLTGGVNFAGLSVGIGNAQIGYGNFIQSVVSFVLIAFCIFLMVKGINRLKRKKEQPVEKIEEKLSREEELLAEIRDLLKEQNKK